jgi:hypothetical protein
VEEADDVLAELELKLDMKLMEVDDVGMVLALVLVLVLVLAVVLAVVLVLALVLVLVLGLMLDEEGDETDAVAIEEGAVMAKLVGV